MSKIEKCTIKSELEGSSGSNLEEMLADAQRCREATERNRVHHYNRLRDRRLELIKHNPEVVDTELYKYLLIEEEKLSVSYEQKLQEFNKES